MQAGQRLDVSATTFGLAVSLALHLALLAYLIQFTSSFDFDFELTVPAEVEFGLTDEIAAVASAPSALQDQSERRAATAPRQDTLQPAIDAGVPPPPESDADNEAQAALERKAKRPMKPESKPRREASDAEATSEREPFPVAPSTITGPSRIPPGAQLALRIDMKRIRESPLGPDVTRFLMAIPDWQLLLEGSGIDPVLDLDRLLVATPNLERSKLVLAGKHRRGPAFARDRVQTLARSRGKAAHWRRRFGVPTADWHNLDTTRRTIALLSSHHFTITRRQDLARVLALTRARELRDADQEGLVEARGPDALLSMGPEEVISLEIEGVRRFIVGSLQHIPLRLRVAVRETGSNEATVVARATYATPRESEEAAEFWSKVASFYSQQLFMTLAGFGKTLRRMEIRANRDRVEVSFKLGADQVRFLLSYAEGRLQSRRSPVRAPSNAAEPAPAKKGP